MEKDWVMVFSTSQPYLAELAKQALEENQIRAVIINKQDSSYRAFGETEVYVQRDHAVRARNLVKNLSS